MQRKDQLLPAVFLLLLCCSHGVLRAQYVHSGLDPLTNSLQTRQLYYNKGNLVPNASFEDGPSLSHWKFVGKNVSLTDDHEGSHAIKITRSYTDVAEVNNTSNGVLSDFIEVIPANFDFYFDIRLENIIPTALVDRFQTRIDKDIDIHLVFYDRDKKELDPGVFFEYVGRKVDNSFKGFAFSNYFYIDKFDWARIHGRTWDYPFSEGDLPENCKYVKIFLGLKCSGTMWVDNIDFRLSRWNFTPIEREDSFFHRKHDLSQLLLPTPKSVSDPAQINLKNKAIRIVYQGPDAPESRSAIQLLQEKLKGVKHGSTTMATTTSSSGDLQIVLLKEGQQHSSKLDDAFAAIKNKDQGYFIRRDGNTIYLGANNGSGLFYSVTTLSQLIDYQHSAIDCADITDYPDFTGRAVQLGAYPNRWQLQQNKALTDSAIEQTLQQRDKELATQVKDLDFYAFYKMNQLYSYASFNKRWWLPGDFFNTFYKKIGERCAGYGDLLNTAVQLNTYIQFNMEQQEETLSDSLRNLFAIGSDEGFEKIKNVLRPVLDAGVKTIELCSDDFVPHAGILRGEYTLYNNADKRQFTNLAAAHSFLVQRTKTWLDKEYHNIRLEFIPPQYNNRFIDYGRGSAEMYFKDLASHLDSSVALVWTGNTVRSLSYDLADIRRATDLYGRKPMIFDNTPYARHVETYNGGYPTHYPERSVLCNIFEPFDIQYPKDFASYLDGRYYSNLTGKGEINKIKYMTFADFTWNPNAYDPELSLYKALVQYAGEKNAVLLLQFSEAYFRFVGIHGRLRLDLKHDSTFHYSQQEKTKAEQTIASMKAAFAALHPVQNEALKKELEDLMNTRIDAWRKLIK
jgi:hypothetical protein